MKNIIEYFNNNAFVASLVTLGLSVILSAITTIIVNRIERKQNNKEKSKEQKRDELLNKGELRLEKRNQKEYIDRLDLSYDEYKKKGLDCIYDKSILSYERTRSVGLRLKNIGNSQIVELYFVVYYKDKNTLIEDSKLKEYIDNNWANSVVGYYNKILPGECLAVSVSYRENSNVLLHLISEVTIYYKDGYGNYYSQLLFLGDENIEEPHLITEKEYKKQIRNND